MRRKQNPSELDIYDHIRRTVPDDMEREVKEHTDATSDIDLPDVADSARTLEDEIETYLDLCGMVRQSHVMRPEDFVGVNVVRVLKF